MIGKQIHIEQCGFLTTLQDNGRKGFLQFGVSKGGAMDSFSAKLSNILVGNNENESVLEITQSPHRFTFLQDTIVAFTGGGLQPQSNDNILFLNQPVFIPAGTRVELKQQLPGYRLYMSVAGGFKCDHFLNSCSTDLIAKAGGHYGRTIRKEDLLLINPQLNKIQKIMFSIFQSGAYVQLNDSKNNFHTNYIRVMKSVEWNYLTENSMNHFKSDSFKLDIQSNRMGYRFKQSDLTAKESCEIISSPVTQGTIQLTPSGELIILMADAQTVGGYPRIAQVCEADLSVLAQKKPGDEIRFQMISLQDAEELYLKEIEQLTSIKQKLQQLYAG